MVLSCMHQTIRMIETVGRFTTDKMDSICEVDGVIDVLTRGRCPLFKRREG